MGGVAALALLAVLVMFLTRRHRLHKVSSASACGLCQASQAHLHPPTLQAFLDMLRRLLLAALLPLHITPPCCEHFIFCHPDASAHFDGAGCTVCRLPTDSAACRVLSGPRGPP